jgi:dipeptidyl aminopeptidase/acylaminoacyl peptidase
VLQAAGAPERPRAFPRVAIAAALLLLAGGATLVIFWPRLMPAAKNAESKKEISVRKLTNGPVPAAATISPDGNVFAYHEIDGETWRMYVQQTGQSSRIEIASSSDKTYAAKTFSPDGRSIYYLATDKKTPLVSLYRIPTMGGAAVKVLDNVYGRCLSRQTEKSWLFVAPTRGPARATS